MLRRFNCCRYWCIFWLEGEYLYSSCFYLQVERFQWSWYSHSFDRMYAERNIIYKIPLLFCSRALSSQPAFPFVSSDDYLGAVWIVNSEYHLYTATYLPHPVIYNVPMCENENNWRKILLKKNWNFCSKLNCFATRSEKLKEKQTNYWWFTLWLEQWPTRNESYYEYTDLLQKCHFYQVIHT